MNKKTIFIFITALAVFGTFFAHVKTSQAVVEINEYTVLAPLPGTTKGGGNCVGDDCKADLASYIPGLFNLLIGLAAVVAVAYIIYGGFLYITTDAIMGKEAGKKHIHNAIYGLIMISVAWLILFTINPRILNFNLNIDAITVPSGPGGTLGGGAPCANCTTSLTESGLTVKAGTGTYATPQLANALVKLNADVGGIGGMIITEGNPPSYPHDDPCHANGTCVDMQINNPTSANIITTLNAISRNGLTGKYEVVTQAYADALIQAGVPASSIMVNTSASGPHFHVKI